MQKPAGLSPRTGGQWWNPHHSGCKAKRSPHCEWHGWVSASPTSDGSPTIQTGERGTGWAVGGPRQTPGAVGSGGLGQLPLFLMGGAGPWVGGVPMAKAPGIRAPPSQPPPSAPVMTALRLLGLLAGLLATSRAGECLPQARRPHPCRGPAAGDRLWWEGPAGVSPCFPGLKAQGGKATWPRPHSQAGPDQPWEGGPLSF